MVDRISRRTFLKVSTALAGGAILKPPPPYFIGQPPDLGRVTITYLNLRAEPSVRARRLTTIPRDTILSLEASEISDDGPAHNPLWYRVDGGYAHSGNIQPVRWQPCPPLDRVPGGGALFEVCVPFTRAYQQADTTSKPLYRLYYQSTAWVEAVTTGADGRAWYVLNDDLLNVEYCVRAEHLRIVGADEVEPISPHIAPKDKYILVSLQEQEVLAYEQDQLVFRTRISSGVPSASISENGIPTATPRGRFYITKKMPVRHMGDGHLTADLEAYELPGVPWVSYFHYTGVAFHGTYWHCDYGRPKSHGCINMRPEEALWIYRWTTPPIALDERISARHGTTVEVV
jgi:hypothetical protein